MSREAAMNDELKKTTRIVRGPKVKTDDRGRSVWADTVKTANLELVSTQMLQQLIDNGDDATTSHLREVAEGKDGLLAHDTDKGRFEIISDEELQHILDGTDAEYIAKKKAAYIEEPTAEVVEEEEEFELVSTQMLRQILSPEDFSEDNDAAPGSGFDPYNHT
jgi:hypothetical protein